MDDRTNGIRSPKGIDDESTMGRGEDSHTRQVASGTPRPRNSTTGAAERSRNWSDEPSCGSAGVDERLHGSAQRTDRIRAEIEQTKDRMSETIDEIQERLRPSNVASNVRDTASRAASSVRSAASEALDEVAESRVVQQVWANPIPSAMVGIGMAGLAWLAFDSRNRQLQSARGRRSSAFGYNEREQYYRQTGAPPLSGATADSATGEHGAVERARELASKTGEYAREVGWKAQQTSRRAQTQLQRALNENPLFVGAAALAAGAMIGMAVPETEKENEWMGETRDNVVEEAQQVARNAATRVQDAATDAVKRVQNVVTDPVKLLSQDD